MAIQNNSRRINDQAFEREYVQTKKPTAKQKEKTKHMNVRKRCKGTNKDSVLCTIFSEFKVPSPEELKKIQEENERWCKNKDPRCPNLTSLPIERPPVIGGY